MSEFNRQYKAVLSEVMARGTEELNERTDTPIKALPGQLISISQETDGLPILSLRALSLPVVVSEPLWFLTGSRRPDEFLNKFAKIWDGFENIDGTVSTAYGYRWRHAFGRDQISSLIKLLSREPSSRHGVVFAWNPAEDGLGGIKRKNVPCPIGFTFNVIGGKGNFQNLGLRI